MFAIGIASLKADHRAVTLAVTMTNDPVTNQIKVYDVGSRALLQTLSTRGKGGAGGNARGVKQYRGEIVAVVNNGSNTVALYKRDGNGLRFDKLVTTTSAPVSIDFANDHMYVAGATTVDSFVIRHNSVEWLDGTASLELATGGAPPAGSTAQVGAVDERRLLVTLKTDPDPGTVDVVRLRDGAITGAAPVAVTAPAGTLTPFGFSVYPDGTAVITLAHSSQAGLFRDGAFTSVIDATQAADCWIDTGRQVRLYREHRQQDHQPPGRHREQCLRGRVGSCYHRDRRCASGHRHGRRRAGRDRPWRRTIALVVVHLHAIR